MAAVRTLLVLAVNAAFASAYTYNPDVDLDTPQLIKKYGYPSEAHTIQTDDGYLLTLHRIPHGREKVPVNATRHPVFLQHGLLGSSADWVITGPGKALAYILADSGYDVWLGNVRGNTYSRNHVKLAPTDSKFWDFSWHEMGIHDLPAAIDWVLKVTNKTDLFYVGHSMGTTMFYVMASVKTEYNSKVRAMFSLAPIAYMGQVKSPIKYLAPFAKEFRFLMHLFGEDEFLPQSKIMRLLSKFACEIYTTEEKICENAVFILTGFDAPQFNLSLLPVVLSHTPAGASTRTLAHYAQEIRSGRFQYFDYGPSENIQYYNQATPLQYNLSYITVPVQIHFALNDWLAGLSDVYKLSKQLVNKLGENLVKLPGFNHVDFLWALDVKSLVYDKVLDTMQKIGMNAVNKLRAVRMGEKSMSVKSEGKPELVPVTAKAQKELYRATEEKSQKEKKRNALPIFPVSASGGDTQEFQDDSLIGSEVEKRKERDAAYKRLQKLAAESNAKWKTKALVPPPPDKPKKQSHRMVGGICLPKFPEIVYLPESNHKLSTNLNSWQGKLGVVQPTPYSDSSSEAAQRSERSKEAITLLKASAEKWNTIISQQRKKQRVIEAKIKDQYQPLGTQSSAKFHSSAQKLTGAISRPAKDKPKNKIIKRFHRQATVDLKLQSAKKNVNTSKCKSIEGTAKKQETKGRKKSTILFDQKKPKTFKSKESVGKKNYSKSLPESPKRWRL